MKCAGLGLAKGLSVTRVDSGILEEGRGTAWVGDRLLQLRSLPSPEGYELVICRQEHPALI
jgi:hypothetical protein